METAGSDRTHISRETTSSTVDKCGYYRKPDDVVDSAYVLYPQAGSAYAITPFKSHAFALACMLPSEENSPLWLPSSVRDPGPGGNRR